MPTTKKITSKAQKTVKKVAKKRKVEIPYDFEFCSRLDDLNQYYSDAIQAMNDIDALSYSLKYDYRKARNLFDIMQYEATMPTNVGNFTVEILDAKLTRGKFKEYSRVAFKYCVRYVDEGVSEVRVLHDVVKADYLYNAMYDFCRIAIDAIQKMYQQRLEEKNKA